MTNLLIIALLIVLAIGVGRMLVDAMLGIMELCSKFARVVDRTPNRILIPICFTAPLWVFGFAALIVWLHG